MIASKPAIVSSSLTYLPGVPGELLGDEVRLREEPLDLARPRDDELVLVGELVHPEDRDDVLQVLVALEDLLDARRDAVVVVGDDPGLERAGGRVERVHRRVDALLDDRARERRRRVEVGERVRRGRVGEVVGGDVDRLHRRDRARRRRGDALLELAHLGRERRLVADGARHAAEQRRDLGARLDEAEDVVDEEEDVLALVAEVLGHREPGEAHPEPRAGRLVHLPVDERDLVDHARLGHLHHQVGALARALADAREDRDAAVLLREVVDQLLDEHRLAHPGAAEQADLAALDVGRDQVDALEAGLEDLDLRREVAEGGGIAVDRPALRVRGHVVLAVDGLADHVPEPAERRRAHGHRDRSTGVDDGDTPREAVGGVHRDRADAVVTQVLLHLGDQRAGRQLDLEGAEDLGEVVGEDGVEHDALDLDDLPDVLLLRHGSPGGVRVMWVARRGGAARACASYPSAARPRPVDGARRCVSAPTPHGRRDPAVRRRRRRSRSR